MAWQDFSDPVLFQDGVYVNVRGVYATDALDQTTPLGAGNGYYNNFWQELNPADAVNPNFRSFYDANFSGTSPYSYNNTPSGGVTHLAPPALTLAAGDGIVGTGFNDYIQTGANRDLILAGAGKDIVRTDNGALTRSKDIVDGGTGDDFLDLGGDRGSVSVTLKGAVGTLGRTSYYTDNTDVNNNLNAFKNEWVTAAQTQGIQLYGTAFDGVKTDYLSATAISNLTLSKSSWQTYGSVGGLGTPSSYAGWYNDATKDRAEINFDPNTGLSQKVTVQWASDKSVQLADIDLSGLSNKTAEKYGDEVGYVQAFKNGVEVDITGQHLNSNGIYDSLTITKANSEKGLTFNADRADGDYKMRLAGDFNQLVFSAKGYVNESGTPVVSGKKTDSSDYLIQQISYVGHDIDVSSLTVGDVVTGGAGADKFLFNKGYGVDLITDFNSTEGDKILMQGYQASDVTLIGTTAAFKNGSSYEAITSTGTSSYTDPLGTPVNLTGNNHIWQLSDFTFV